jgi:hypothetical protein
MILNPILFKRDVGEFAGCHFDDMGCRHLHSNIVILDDPEMNLETLQDQKT